MVSGKLLNNCVTMMWPFHEDCIDSSPGGSPRSATSANTPDGSPRGSSSTLGSQMRKVTGRSKLEAERVKKELADAHKAWTDGQGNLEYSLPRNAVDYSLPQAISTDTSQGRRGSVDHSPVRAGFSTISDTERLQMDHQLNVTATERDDALEELERLRGLNLWRGRDHNQIRSELVNTDDLVTLEEQEPVAVPAALTETETVLAAWRRRILMEELVPLNLVTVRRATTLTDDVHVLEQWVVYKRYHVLMGRWLTSWRERVQLWNSVVRDVILHWQKRRRFAAVQSWRQACGWQQRSRLGMREAMLQLYRRDMGRALEHWMREQWQFVAAEMARQQFLLGSAITRLIKRQMSMAWEKWQQVYADVKFANRMGGGAIRRMLNRKLSMAWEQWQFVAAEMARQQFLLGGAMTRLIKRQMSMAWEKWQQVYADVKFANRMGGGVTAFTWWMFYILAAGLMCLASRTCIPSPETSGKA